MKQIIVIGGGPSGMMAAISSKEHWPEANVILLERNERLGKKLRLTGGGRCNVTADVDVQEVIKYVPKNGKFLNSALTNFNPQDIQAFFEANGCPLKKEDHERMFPASNKSHSIVDALQSRLEALGVDIRLHSYVESLDSHARIVTVNGKDVPYDALILATGSRSLSGTGSDGNGYVLASSFGHTITELLPAEVPLVSNDVFIQEKALQGLSFHDVVLNVHQGKKIKKAITHDLLFTHFGLSGPAALRGSFYVQQVLEKEAPVRLTIDFLKDVSIDTLMQAEDIEAYALEAGVPKRLLAFIKEQANNKNMIIDYLKRFPMTTYETRGFSHAFVTNGGISLKEINPKTLKSKLDPHISCIGELLDYNAFTGGFNITSAFATGFTAGKYALDIEA